jgi:hypothetical protein
VELPFDLSLTFFVIRLELRVFLMHCLRCDAVELEPESSGDAEFVKCPRCGHHFRVSADGALVERWLDPLSIVLYPVISETLPQQKAEWIADELYAASQPGTRGIFQSFSREQLQQISAEVRMELKHPTQNVRDILDLRGDEEALRETPLREYLTIVVKRLGILLGENNST